MAIWKISLRFFSPPEKPTLTPLEENEGFISTISILLRISLRKSAAFRGSRPLCLRCSLTAVRMKLTLVTPGISMGYWEVQDVAAVECDFSGGDGVAVPAGQDCREGGFAGAVGTHNRVGLAFAYCQVDASEYFLVAHTGVQTLDFE